MKEKLQIGRSPWSQNRFPRNFVPPPSGDGHVDFRRPTWLVYVLSRSLSATVGG